MHGSQAAESREHLNVLLPSLLSKTKLAVVSVVGDKGPLVMSVCGACVSIVQA